MCGKILWNLPKVAKLDVFLVDVKKLDGLVKNATIRDKSINLNLIETLRRSITAGNKQRLSEQVSVLPNQTHPDVVHYKEPQVIKTVGTACSSKRRPFENLTKPAKWIRTDHLGNVAGTKAYYLLGNLAELERAILRYAMRFLLHRNFQALSVSDIVHRDVIEACGMRTKGGRTQVFALDERMHGPDLCLSGTAEMSIAAYLMNRNFTKSDLPKRFFALSRCYRAEVSSTFDEKGLYRVHEFNKLEMFSVCTEDQSNEELLSIRQIQEEIFNSLGLHYKVLDMQPEELGLPAYRKFDIEAYMSGREIFGEISSCSNCTDYQSKRLNITVDGEKYAHTVNGTACAIPRLLIAIVENAEHEERMMKIPEVLQKDMKKEIKIGANNSLPTFKLQR